MRKFNSVSKFLFLFVFSLAIFSFSPTKAFAEDTNELTADKTQISTRSVLYWKKGTATNIKYGEWELKSTGNKKYVETEQTYHTKTTARNVADVTAIIEGNGGFVTGTASAGYNSSGEELVEITYKKITKEIMIYDLYHKYKYYYTESILVDTNGNVYDTDPYGYFIKKEYFSSKEIKTGSEAP